MPDVMTREQRSRCMSRIGSKNTRPEIAVRQLVHRMGFRFRLHVRSLPGTPDLVLPRLRKIINVHGCFWHQHRCGRARIPGTRAGYWKPKLAKNKERDRTADRALRRRGWKVLTIWECETFDAARLALKLRTFLRS